VLEDFEQAGHGSWTVTGNAFGAGPATGNVPPQGGVAGFAGERLANSFHDEDRGTGTLTSPEFTLDRPYLNFLIGGGHHPYPADAGNPPTAVNLVADGEVVRTATGGDSETLDWTSWHVGDLAGRRARIQIVDRNTGGWGHILADQLSLADAPARSRLERSSWVDYGMDHYAAVTFNDAPGGRRIAIGWMNNWRYAGAIPTSPWRSAMSVPRELGLRTIDGVPRLVSAPVAELRTLRERRWAPKREPRRVLGAGATETLPVRGKALELDAVLRVGTSGRAGLKVRTGAGGEETVIGYDAGARELYVDRRASGADAFSREFARDVQRAPLAPRGGRIRFRVLVDWSSVEVFGDRGQVVLSDQIHPRAESDGVALFAEGAAAVVESLRAWPLRSIWTESRRARPDRPDAAQTSTTGRW
jgi:sucrose-6-phosphate hydrolase SacC (GH32 family)